MSRLKGVSDSDADLGAKIAFFFTKRKLAQCQIAAIDVLADPDRIARIDLSAVAG